MDDRTSAQHQDDRQAFSSQGPGNFVDVPRSESGGQAGAVVRASRKLEVRPILVVGVGGTGCLAVQHVKRRVRRILGHDAPFIRYLVFDTTIADDSIERFEEGEFINLGQLDFSTIVQDIQSYEHLEYWFPKERLKPMQVGLGAMGVRHIGRLCYFQWRESSEVRDRILERLKELKSAGLKDKVFNLSGGSDLVLDQSSGIDVHVVGSGAGGTGSGLFLDLCFDLRRLAKDIAGSARLIGHILLPDAFEGLIPDPVLPQAENNSHALLSEIDHFTHNGGWEVRYRNETYKSDEPPLDLIYLLGRNGMDGAVRTRDEIMAMIGTVIAGLGTSAVGKHIMDSAVNLIPPILSRTDELEDKPCPYASYGTAIGMIELEDAQAKGRGLAIERVLDELLTGAVPDGHTVDDFVEQHVSEHRIDLSEIERGLIDVPTASPQGAGPREAEMFRKGQHSRSVRDLATEQERWIDETVAKRMQSAFGDGLAARLRRILRHTRTSESGVQERMPLAVLELFLERSAGQLTGIVQACERALEDLTTDASAATRGLQDLLAQNPAPPNWVSRYAELVRREDEKACRAPFYSRLRELCIDERTQLSKRIDEIAGLREALRGAHRRLDRSVARNEHFDPPYFQVLSTDQLLAAIVSDAEGVGARVREYVAELLASSEPSRAYRGLRERLDEIAGDALDRVLESHRLGGQMNVHTACRGVDAAYLRDRARTLYTLAQPGFRCEEQYPKERIVNVGYVSGDPRSELAMYLRRIDGTLQVIPDLHADLTMIRFVYGAPLWAIHGVKRWEDSATEVQTAERATHNLLDETWADDIGPLVPRSEELLDDLWLFSMFCRSGKIAKKGFTYTLYATRLDGIRERSAMFAEFQRLLSEGKLPRERAERDVEDFLIRGRDDAGVLALLREHLETLAARLKRGALSGLGREDLKLLREEVQVVKSYVRMKERDLDGEPGVDGPLPMDVVDSGTSPVEEDRWLFTILSCSERIGFEPLPAFDGHKLPEDGRAAAFEGFRRLLDQGVVTRETLNRDVQDYLISGEDERASFNRLQSHIQVLQEAARMGSAADAEAVAAEVAAVQEYLQGRWGSGTP